MASGVSERRDRAHLSCATIPIVTPGSYRRGRLLLWMYLASSIFLQFFPSTSSSSTCSRLGSGLPWFLRFSPRRADCLLSSSWFVVLLLVSAGSVGNPCGCRGSAPPFFLVFLEVFVVWITPSCLSTSSHLLPLFMDFSQGLYFGHFYGISELRGARQVERFAQCSF